MRNGEGMPRTIVVAAAMLFVLFLMLTFAVLRGGSLVSLDAALARTIAESAPTGLLRLAATLTHLGDPLVRTIGVAVLVAVTCWRRSARLGLLAIVAVGGAGLLTNVVKLATDRVRPLHVSEWITVSGGSFPSGHASGAVAFYGVLGYLLARQVPERWRHGVSIGCGTIAFAVACTRVILRAHWLSDAVAGVVLGLAWLLLCIAVAESGSRGPGVEPLR